MMEAPLISVVSPVYLGEKQVRPLVEEIIAGCKPLTSNIEIVLVDDGSPDGSWEAIEAVCAEEPRVVGVKLSRNFGQQNALSAGLDASRGDYVVVMDCDLQDDPKYIPELYAKAQEGFDVVYTLKHDRAHTSFRNITGRTFHRILSWLAGPGFHSDSRIGNYTLITRSVVEAFRSVGDYHRSYLIILHYLGFRTSLVEIEHRERLGSKSTYTLRKLINEAINITTSQTDRLLHASIVLGFTLVGLSIATIVLLVVLYYSIGFREGWTSLVVLQLFSTGLILSCLGVVGIYIGKIFDQVKGRPAWVVMQTRNFERDRRATPLSAARPVRSGSSGSNVAELPR